MRLEVEPAEGDGEHDRPGAGARETAPAAWQCRFAEQVDRQAERDQRNEPVVFTEGRDSVHRRVEKWAASDLDGGLREEIEIGMLPGRRGSGQPEEGGQ